MRYILPVLISTMLALFVCQQSYGQISVTGATNTTPNLSTSYTTLANAITALNGITAISGSVTIALTAGHKETAPAGGYTISFTATSTAADTIIIDGSPSYDTIVANGGLTAGNLYDAVFKIIGSDYVTIKRFTLLENTANTTTALATNNMTEWGVALLRRATGQDGAQHNRIIDNIISLNRTYPNSFGIYSNVRHLPTTPLSTSDITSVTGSNLANKFYSNRISNVNMGIAVIGCNVDSRMDDSNDIGGASSLTGNTITNWGGNSLATAAFSGNFNTEYFGISMRNQKNNNISWNTITSSTSLGGSVAAAVRGIHNGTISGTVTPNFSTNIDFNTVTITDNLPNSTGTAGRLDGIVCENKLGTLSISNNTITGLAVATSASNKFMRCISNSASATDVYINYNSIFGNTSTASTSPGSFSGIEQTGIISNIVEINYNSVGDANTSTAAITYSVTPSSSATILGISNSPSTPTGASYVDLDYNSFYGFVTPGSASNRHIYLNLEHTTSFNSVMHVDYNEFVNIDAHTSNDVYLIQGTGVMAASAGAQLNVSHNSIVGSFTKSLGGGDVYLYNARGSSGIGNTMVEDGNNFSNITLTTSTVMHGWFNNEGVSAAGPEKSIINNIFENWSCGTSGSSTSNVIYCDWASGSSEVSRNTVSNITAYAALNGIFSAASNAALTIDGNAIFALESTTAALIGVTVSAGGTVSNNGINLQSSTATSVFGISLNTTGALANTIATYYNTVYLRATPPISAINFGTSCLTVKGNAMATTDQSIVRNNLLINTSTPKGNGKTSCLYNTGAHVITNYHPSSNNNDFWVGSLSTNATPPNSTITTDPTHVIYDDGPGGSNDKQDVAAFKSYVLGLGAETLSFSLMPDFYSSIPPVDLHLTSSAINCPIFDHGNSQNIPLVFSQSDQPVYGSTKRLVVWPYVTDIGADQVIVTDIWTGAINNSWNVNSNWSLGYYPNNAGVTAYIPKATGARPQPSIASGATWQVDNVFFQPGVAVPLLTSIGKLQVAGVVSGNVNSYSNYNGLVPDLVKGSIEMNGTCGTQIQGGLVFKNKKIFNFIINNNVQIPSITNGNQGIKVVNELSFGAGFTLNTGTSVSNNDENLTLVSTNDLTAHVAQLATSNDIIGDVTVERYVNSGLGAATTTPPVPAQHTKSWQFLSTPTGGISPTTTGQTVYQSWQESQVNTNGYGTLVVGNDATFDITTATASIEYWDPYAGTSSVGDWVDITNTGGKVYDQRGYQVFVRGDRTVTNPSAPPTPANLRTKGPLFTANNVPPATTVQPGGSGPTIRYTSIGNPYASPISLTALVSTGFSGVSPTIVVWDPLLYGSFGLGGYQYLTSTAGVWSASPGGTDFYSSSIPLSALQSSQAFLVTSSSTSATGNVTFNEAQKSTSYSLVNKSTEIPKRVIFTAALYTSDGNIADGNTVKFDDSYSNGIDNGDAYKFPNPGENFMLVRENKNLAIETRKSIAESDSLFYDLNKLKAQTYQLRFASQNLNEMGLRAYLIDKYLGKTSPLSLSDTTSINFVVTDEIKSYKNRFVVVFRRGEESLASSIDKVTTMPNKSGLVISPNPVTDKTVRFSMIAQNPDDYSVRLVSHTGQLIYSGHVRINDSKTIQTVTLRTAVSAGNYELTLISSEGKKWNEQVLIK